MPAVLKLTEESHALNVDVAPPYDLTINYEDGTSELVEVREVDGSIQVLIEE